MPSAHGVLIWAIKPHFVGGGAERLPRPIQPVGRLGEGASGHDRASVESHAVAQGKLQGAIMVAALRAFVAVVNAGRFSAAGAALGLSQRSVSAQVQNLEDAFGLRLLHRRGRLKLTDDGRTLLVRARLALARIDEFSRAASDLTELRGGRLVPGFSTPAFALPLLARLTAAHPGVEIATRIANPASLLTDLAECRADVAVMACAAPPLDHAVVVLSQLRLGLAVPADDTLARRAGVSIDSFGATQIQREPGSMTRALFEAARTASAPMTLVAPSREALKKAVAARLGYGVLFDGEIGPDPHLAFVPFTAPEAVAVVCAVARREMAEVPAVAALLAVTTSS